MKSIELKSFAKINLSLDVGRPMADGMHPVDMVMQLVSLCDIVSISVQDEASTPEILLTCNHPDLPLDRRNLAYRAAEEILKKAQEKGAGNLPKTILIDIDKIIPLEAGLAGGSGNAAAVLLGLNKLLDLELTMDELCELAAGLGADVPFCLMGQAKYLMDAGGYAARATGTGTDLAPCVPMRAYAVLVKPTEGISTKEVYQGFDKCQVDRRPDNDKLVDCLEFGDYENMSEEMINLLELYTLEARPDIKALKWVVEECSHNSIKVLMSGSGPTIFSLFEREEDAKFAEAKIRNAISSDENMALIGPCSIFCCETLC